MSLRKSTRPTSRRLDANRRNAQRSTGPRSEAGKQRMRMNALQHGWDAAPQNEAAVMRALGEDPERYAALQRQLATAYGPGDALWDRQLDDLARLYWRRQRIERMETGLMRQDLAAVEERRRELVRALADVTFDPSQCDAVTLDLPQPTHPCVRLRMLISLWGVIREQVRRRVFTSEQQRRIEPYYAESLGWRPRQIGHLLRLFGGRAYLQQSQDRAELKQYVKDKFGGEAEVEARYQELARLLQEQLAEEEAAFAEEMKAQEEKYAIERDACLAPADETWERLLRQEAALDRSIDRKVRILLTLRKEQARLRAGGSRTAPTGAPTIPPEEESNEREAQELSKLVGLNPAEVAPTFRSASAHADLKVSATNSRDGARESAAAEDAGPTSKSPEQSQNVIENKAPAAEETNA